MSTLDSSDQLPYSVLLHMLYRNHEESTNALMELYTRTSGTVYALASTMASSPVHTDENGQKPTPEEALVDVYTDLWVNNQQIGNWLADTEPEWLAAFYSHAHQHLIKLYNSEDDAESVVPHVVSAYTTERQPVPNVPVPHAIAPTVDALPAAAKEVFNLAYLQGLNYYQIAEKTGSSVGTVKSRLRIMVIRLMDEQPEAIHDPLMVQQHYFARDDSKRTASGQFGANLKEDLSHGLLLPWAELLATGALNAAERKALRTALHRADEETRNEFIARYRQGIVALSQVVQNLRADVSVDLREKIATDITELEPTAPAERSPELQDTDAVPAKKNSGNIVVLSVLLVIILAIVLFFVLN